MAGNKKTIKNLVFQGGGPKVVAFAGGYAAFAEHMNEVENTAGSSAGAIAATAAALGMPPEEFKDLLIDCDFISLYDNGTSIINYSDFGFKVTGHSQNEGLKLYLFYKNFIEKEFKNKINSFVKQNENVNEIISDRINKIEHNNEKHTSTINYLSEEINKIKNESISIKIDHENGNISCSDFMEKSNKLNDKENKLTKEIECIKNKIYRNALLKNAFLEIKLHESIEFKVTFSHVKALNLLMPEIIKNIYISGTACEYNKVDIFCFEHTPEMEVAIGLRISTAIPPTFQAVIYNGVKYIDGGTGINLLVDPFIDPCNIDDNSLTLAFAPSNEQEYTVQRSISLPQKLELFALRLGWGLSKTSYEQKSKAQIQSAINSGYLKVINLPHGEIGTFSFNTPKEIKEIVYNSSYQKAMTEIPNLIHSLNVPSHSCSL